VHAIKETPVVRNGQIVVGKKMYLSVSIDHRLVDGATGARWMNVIKDMPRAAVPPAVGLSPVIRRLLRRW
jgi:pyruvate/2-oxoglutarate dehydrogenase complex dihydrolipoamide acyltransferase (E2) component